MILQAKGDFHTQVMYQLFQTPSGNGDKGGARGSRDLAWGNTVVSAMQ